MDILHAYQAELSGDLDRAESMSSDNIRELRRATDLTLRATKETARAVGRSYGIHGGDGEALMA